MKAFKHKTKNIWSYGERVEEMKPICTLEGFKFIPSEWKEVEIKKPPQ